MITRFFMCVFALAWSVPLIAEGMTYEELRRTVKASMNAPAVIEYKFDVIRQGSPKKCLYSRSHEKFYFGGYAATEHGAQMPFESAWDGVDADLRVAVGMMSTKRDRAFAGAGETSPELIYFYVRECYDLRIAPPIAQYQFIRVRDGGTNLVIAEFDCLLNGIGKRGGKVEIYHRLDKGCLPERLIGYDSNGQVDNDIRVLEYFDVSSSEGLCHVPGNVERYLSHGGKHGELTLNARVKVDRASILTDDKVTRTYRLEPWPNEFVTDMNTGKDTAPKDPNWIPDDRVGFAFKPFVDRLIAAGKYRKKSALAAGNEGVQTLGRQIVEGSVNASVDPVSKWTVPLIAGGALLAGGVFAAKAYHRKAS